MLVLYLLCAPIQAWAIGDISEGSILQPAAFYHTGTYALRDSDPNLTKQGITIAMVCRSQTYIDSKPQDDYLLNTSHECFTDRKITFIDNITAAAGISAHATAIGGILSGLSYQGSYPGLGEFEYEGAAPDADVDVYEFWRFVSGYVFGEKEFDADILTMSVGVVFDTWWTRGLGRMADKQGTIIVAGIGNGSEVSDSVLYPGVGPNVIGVGVIDSAVTDDIADTLSRFTLPHSEHSSSGPSYDGRCGPDLVAPGNCIVPMSKASQDYEISGDWSSFATPVVSGTIAMLVQAAKNDPAPASAADNRVIRSILMTSATKLPYWHKGLATPDDDHQVSLDHLQGAGLLNAVDAYAILTAGIYEPNRTGHVGWDNNAIEKQPEAFSVYTVDTSDSTDEFITATLVWNKHYKDKYPFEADTDNDSDLRLEIWAVDINEPGNSYMLDYSDSINDNIEHIHVPIDPDFSTYEIIVSFGNTPQYDPANPTESYALSWRTSSADEKNDYLWYDLNGDTVVDVADILLILINTDKSPETEQGYMTGDINMDGIIDTKDAIILLNNIDRPEEFATDSTS